MVLCGKYSTTWKRILWFCVEDATPPSGESYSFVLKMLHHPEENLMVCVEDGTPLFGEYYGFV